MYRHLLAEYVRERHADLLRDAASYRVATANRPRRTGRSLLRRRPSA